ncbi:MAG: META domain-containing protein [Flavobacteriaceae bacterium]|nr:META domain-containing protein [Flavobacteriaceae bacterium]
MKKNIIIIVGILMVSLFYQCKSAKEKKAFSQDLNSGEFSVESLNGNDVQNHELTFLIDAEQNRISGQSSCNGYGVSYELEEGVLELGFVIATKMYCDGKMELESEFMSAVGRIHKFKYQDHQDVLVFFDDEGKKIIELRKQ